MQTPHFVNLFSYLHGQRQETHNYSLSVKPSAGKTASFLPTSILFVNSEVLTFGMITFLNLAFHIREKIGLETGHKPVDLTSSAYVR